VQDLMEMIRGYYLALLEKNHELEL